MSLGAFSISLSVKDIRKSKAFYEALGFEEMGGNIEHNYLILKNGEALIGLFQGMFDKNTLTFNPGWDQSANEADPFDDVRAIQSRLKAAGLEMVREADSDGSGPDYLTLLDPDGNPVLIDQHRQ